MEWQTSGVAAIVGKVVVVNKCLGRGEKAFVFYGVIKSVIIIQQSSVSFISASKWHLLGTVANSIKFEIFKMFSFTGN